ncbi:MAG: 3-dehydroquinate synthase [Prevotellaceae bacterium]|nr:3-dehydroquinate synthase [Prevotellaceae bacterium]
MLDIQNIIANVKPDYVFVLTDENTHRLCLPLLQVGLQNTDYSELTIAAGDAVKNVETLNAIWHFLSENGATRQSLLLNVGGGTVTDIGGFAAATFKRGIRFVNIPTTLLAIVDAAFGGKTGINFDGLKNQIGAFAQPEDTIVNIDFLKTLDTKNLLAGFAEMLKHSLLSDYAFFNQTYGFDLDTFDLDELKILVIKNMLFKQSITRNDFNENGRRTILNFGHTFAHAFESWFAKTDTPLLHGYAVAWGMLCELYLSLLKLNFPKNIFLKISHLIKNAYAKPDFDCKDCEALYSIMRHDKKNVAQLVNFVLLADIGRPLINQSATKEEIFECLDFLREI